MTGEELRMILRFNKIKHQDICEIAGISISSLNNAMRATTGDSELPKERGNMQVHDRIKIALGSILKANFRDESVVKSFLDNIPNDFKHNVRFDHRRFVNRIAIAKYGGYPDGEKW